MENKMSTLGNTIKALCVNNNVKVNKIFLVRYLVRSNELYSVAYFNMQKNRVRLGLSYMNKENIDLHYTSSGGFNTGWSNIRFATREEVEAYLISELGNLTEDNFKHLIYEYNLPEEN